MESQTFASLLARVAQGDDSAAWTIVERYGSHIRAVVRRRMHPGLRTFLDSDDFVQSVWGSLVRIGPRLHDIHRPEQLVALLARMAQNKVIDEVRRRTGTAKHQVPCSGVAAEMETAKPVTNLQPIASPSQYAIARERWDRMLAGEPPQARQMVELRLAGNTYIEIATSLGINERTVRRTIARLLDNTSDDLN